MHKPFHIPNSVGFCFHFLHGAFGISVEVGTRYRYLHPQAVLLPIETSCHDDQIPCSVVEDVLLCDQIMGWRLDGWMAELLFDLQWLSSLVLRQIMKSHVKMLGCLTQIAQNHNTRRNTPSPCDPSNLARLASPQQHEWLCPEGIRDAKCT